MRLKSIVPSAEVLAGRNIWSWTALAFGAGSVNATAFLACQRFVTHVTGILTHAGVDEGSWGLAVDYVAVLLCFVLGAMTAVLLLDGRRLRGMSALPWLPLVTVSVLLTAVSIAGQFGAFGVFGTEVESDRDFVLLSVLALAMGLQNASVGNATGSLVRTTHMTGPATDLGVALAFMLLPGLPADTKWAAKRTAILRGAKLAAFALGAVAAAVIVPHLGYLAFLMPAAICAMVAVAVFGVTDVKGKVRARTSLLGE